MHAVRTACIEAGRECLAPQEAARLFGVDPSTIRSAKSAGHLEPVFELCAGGGPAVPHYKLGDLIAHFKRTGRAEADPELLATMRAHGTTFYTPVVTPGIWLLLSETGGIRAPRRPRRRDTSDRPTAERGGV